ncbi:putative RNA-binding protein 19 [Hypsibius exemplaris]|uniref:RNA-binding protein 19 n=1 Tax=Hypsibius exemplaris TaxID=2072580 RepID=A0A9X6NG33_HYPEX|nr:putative RNA-binding protein 19 [Hypsibius exemplaris]
MSRLIVKNLPNGITEQRLKTIFEQKGLVTDINLKHAKGGTFRRFAFVGYETEAEAQAAKAYFNATYIDTAKIQVEDCRSLGDIGDKEKTRPWSQHSADSSRFQAREKAIGGAKVNGKVKAPSKEELKKSREEEDKFTQMMRNPLLTDEDKAALEKARNDPEFIEFYQTKQNKSAWNNDDLLSFTGQKPAKPNSKVAEAVPAEKDSAAAGKESFDKMKNAVKVKHLPKGVKKEDLWNFFKPLKILRVNLPKKARDIAFVQFASKADVQAAVTPTYDKKPINGQNVTVSKCQESQGGEGDEAEAAESAAAPEATTDPALQPEPLGDSGRLFVRNLPFSCTHDGLETLFTKFGPVSELILPIDRDTQRNKGYGIVTFMMPEHAVKALSLDGKDFHGRVLHVMPAQPKREEEIPPPPVGSNTSAFKKDKKAKLKNSSQNAKNWNSLFLGVNSVMDVMAEKYNVSKAQILESEGNNKQSAAVRVALGETQIVNETREFLIAHGVKLDAFSQTDSVRSKTVILVKNLPAGTKSEDLLKLFSEHGTVTSLVLPPAGITALVEMMDPAAAKKAFRGLAYIKFGSLPLFLEWAPQDVLEKRSGVPDASVHSKAAPLPVFLSDGASVPDAAAAPDALTAPKVAKAIAEEVKEESIPGATVFVKNLSFATVDDSLFKFFSTAGPVKSATVARKLGPKGETLSMGYGFVEFKNVNAAKDAIRTLQHGSLDGHTLELKVSERTVRPPPENNRKAVTNQEQTSSKIMVRNIPFQASEKEIRDIFRVFGDLKSVRLPKKMGDTGSHRGFCFIEYNAKNDAKRAFDALSQSTHLYARRLVLEWAESDDQNVDVLRHKVAAHFDEDNTSRKKLKKRGLYDELDQSVQAEQLED